ncbi:MAG TPA: hypothetical protein VLA40_12220 [Rheinheimera sp.]|nr:hypothetical protein [Rheinheimera sp.]
MSNIPSRFVVRTIYAAELQTAKSLQIPYPVRANTTLNQKLDIQANAVPDVGTTHAMKYLAIGNGGHRLAVGSDGFAYTAPIPHSPGDSALYNQIPWVLRLESQDLPAASRANYALRKAIVMPDGERYFAYYLKRLSHTDVTTQLYMTTIRDGETTTVPYVPNNSNLNPTPPEIPADGDVPALEQGDYLTAKAMVRITLTPADVNELINVATVLYQDQNYAIISEFALCQGIDKTVTAEGAGGATINFTESINTQVAAHISTYHSLVFANNGLEFTVDVGANEGLLIDVNQSL